MTVQKTVPRSRTRSPRRKSEVCIGRSESRAKAGHRDLAALFVTPQTPERRKQHRAALGCGDTLEH